jgi:hypothetical protein
MEEERANLGGAAEVDGDGPREDGVPEGGAAEVVDAELHPGDAAVARGHVRAHARQRLRHQRRHAAVQHLEGLPGTRGQRARSSIRTAGSNCDSGRWLARLAAARERARAGTLLLC